MFGEDFPESSRLNRLRRSVASPETERTHSRDATRNSNSNAFVATRIRSQNSGAEHTTGSCIIKFSLNTMRLQFLLAICILGLSGCSTYPSLRSRHELRGSLTSIRKGLTAAFIKHGYVVSEEEHSLDIETQPYPGPKRGFLFFKRQWDESLILSLDLREGAPAYSVFSTALPGPVTIATESWRIRQRQSADFPWIEADDSDTARPVMRDMRSVIYQVETQQSE